MKRLLITIAILLLSVGAFAQPLTGDTVAVEPSALDAVMMYAGYLVAALTMLLKLYDAHKARKATDSLEKIATETAIILVNTLKDENKLINAQFSPATIAKAEEVAKALGTENEALKKVKDALNGREINPKLVSIRGKAIYLSDVLTLGGLGVAIRNAWKK